MKNKIEEQIDDNLKPFLSTASKQRIKERVFKKIHAAESQMVKQVAEQVVIDNVKKAQIKERVFEQIQELSKKPFNFGLLSWSKRFVTALTLTVFVFSIVNIMPSGGQVVFAEGFTKVGDVSGEVYLERAGEYLEVSEEMELKEQDRIVTGSDGFIEIEFFDESISRMSSNGEVKIKKLFRPDQSSVRSYVEVSIESGTLWSRVVNLVEKDSAFVVQAGGTYATARKKAAFNMEVVDQEVEVEVFSNVVEVKTAKKLENVVSGKKAVVQSDEDVDVEELVEQEREVTWVKENIDSDNKYINDVEKKYIAAKMELTGVVEDEVVEIKDSKVDKVVLLMTFDDVKQAKKELDIAEKKFIAAELKLAENDLTEQDLQQIEQEMDLFREEIKEFKEVVKDVEIKDSKYAEELDAYLEDKVLNQKKALNTTLPDNPSYKAKEKLKEVELDLAQDDPDKLEEVVKEQRQEKLTEAEEGVLKGDTKTAMQAIDQYEEELQDESDQEEIVDEVEKELKDEIDKSLQMVEKDRGAVDLETVDEQEEVGEI